VRVRVICASLQKAMVKLQATFASLAKLASWQEVREAFPADTSPEALESWLPAFAKSKDEPPPEFSSMVARCMAAKALSELTHDPAAGAALASEEKSIGDGAVSSSLTINSCLHTVIRADTRSLIRCMDSADRPGKSLLAIRSCIGWIWACVLTREGGACVLTREGGACVLTREGGECVLTREGGECVLTREGGECVLTREGGECVLTREGGACVLTREGGRLAAPVFSRVRVGGWLSSHACWSPSPAHPSA
jgi:hypothetical protein